MTDQIPSSTPEAPQLPPSTTTDAGTRAEDRKAQVIIIIVAIVVVACIVASLVFLLTAPADVTAQIRDVFIIVMAFESLLVGLVLTILMVQMAKLTNLMQNELKPILLSLNETINTLKGTSTFLSDNLAEPLIKLNSYLAGLGELLSLIGLGRKPNKKSPQ
jgi:hypothetical protein